MKRQRPASQGVKKPYKKPRQANYQPANQRAGYGSVARARGAAVTGEMKYFDVECQTTALAACTTTWVAGTQMSTNMVSINLGDAQVATTTLFVPKVSAALNGRIGRKVKVMKIKVHCFINVPVQAAQGAADTSTLIRAMLVQDTQTNAANMTGAQLMNDAGIASTTVNSFQNPNNFGRFRVLKEKQMTLSDLNLAGSPTAADLIQNGKVFAWKWSVKYPVGCQVNFNATNGGTIADVIDNSWHIIIGTNSIAYAPTFACYSRFCYKE